MNHIEGISKIPIYGDVHSLPMKTILSVQNMEEYWKVSAAKEMVKFRLYGTNGMLLHTLHVHSTEAIVNKPQVVFHLVCLIEGPQACRPQMTMQI